jgi:predicted aspartyl protease
VAWESRLEKLRRLSRRHRVLLALVAAYLVDTGAIDCLVSTTKLKKIGPKSEGQEVLELANGTTVELPHRFARVRFMGSETVTKVIFGPSAAESILGVAALESTGIGIG